MQKDLIRTDEERAARLQLVKANRMQRHEKYVQQKPTRLDSSVNREQFLSKGKGTSRTLSSNEWTQITDIRSAYEHFCLYPILRADEEREEYLSTQPIKCRLKEHSFIHVLNVRLSSMIAFLRTTLPSFTIDLTRDDRQWLVRANLHYLLLFPSMDLMNINGNHLHFDTSKACHTAYLYVYGQELLSRAKCLILKLNGLIGFDPAIGKLIQIILFLSPCLVTNYSPKISSYQPSLDTIIHLTQTKEQYTETLWSYLVYRYGELEAVRLHTGLIGQVLEHQRFGADLDQSLAEREPFGNLVYELLTSFSVE